jgi:SPP1 gp7 family putative phage head morphogenesis protein
MATLSPVRPSAAIRIRYERELDAAIDAMQADIVRTITGDYRENEPEVTIFAKDASPAMTLRRSMARLRRKWLKRFDELAPKMAAHFAKAVTVRSEASLAADLRKAGFTVRFKMTAAMNDAYQAVIGENVNLIKSIPVQHLTQVETMVMQSVQTGRDIGGLAKGLRERLGVTKRRAAVIARDQNQKATATMTRARYLEMGITKSRWLHSAGGKVPRQSHVAFSGQIYDVAKGVVLDPKEGVVWPGSAIQCRCVAVGLIPGIDEGA